MSDDDDVDSSSGQDNPGKQDDPTGSLYAETYWGEWIRMDADETWYISGGEIKINGSRSSKPVSLAKQSDRVVEVREGGRMYYLYASRIANTSFTGKLAGFEEVSTSVSPSIQRQVAGGKGFIYVVRANVDAKVTNQNNGSTQTVHTDSEGVFTVEDAIPGDEYEITPVTPESETPVSVTVTPKGDGDDVGTITVTEGVNFKTGIKAADGSSPYFYASGTRYDLVIEITNVGTEDCLAATCQLGFGEGLGTSASAEKTVIRTIEPGVTRTIPLSLWCGSIGVEEEYVSKKITIAVTDEISGKTWEDSVSVRFYRASTSFYLQTEPSAAAPVYGVVINPLDSRAAPFKKADGEDLPSVTLPWTSLGYLAVFSKATAETEAAYALGVNQPPGYTDSDFNSFLELNRYEPNDTEQTAREVRDDDMMAYLHKGDIDYYHYTVPYPLDLPLDESLAWISENAEEDGMYAITVNRDETVAPKTLSYSGKNISITLVGGAAERTVSLGSSGSLFTVENGVTLKLGNNITLQGRSDNTSALVYVDSGGTLEMKSGSKISGNTNTYNYCGGVYVDGGTFTMSGGEISGNSAYGGGGVYVSSGTFTKQSGGVIYGRDASSTLANTATGGYIYGHAVYVSESRMRNFTVGTGESLDSTKDDAAGGWAELLPDNLPLNESLAWLSVKAEEGGEYIFTLSDNETVEPKTFYSSSKTVSITLSGGTAERTVSLGSTGSLFTVGSGVTLKLGNNITLQGRSDNTFALVKMDSGGALEMESGSKISGNSASDNGGGVYVGGGTFTMSGGEISGNSTSNAGGGGVYVYGGTFTMNGGEISGNSAAAATGSGGGVSVNGGALFTMNGGTISGNSARYGGGVEVRSSSTLFTMSGGEISGNSAVAFYGGGVYVNGGTFTMSGGEISGNSAFQSGGGVYAAYGTFTKQLGGVIYGRDASSTLTNTATDGYSYGHAVYVSESQMRNFTVGTGESLGSGSWAELRPENLSLNESLAWLNAKAVEGGEYTITVNGDETVEPKTFDGDKTMSITLLGGAVERTVSLLGSGGPLFTVGSGVTLKLGNNITLRGRTNNSSSLVKVNSGGTLEMNSGSKISGNTSSGGVYVSPSGTFIMNGGEISGNSAFNGGGVYISSNGTFTMSGGTISGNSAEINGGGVYVDISGTFTKQSGGAIYGSDANDTLKNTATKGDGHAVYISEHKRNSTAGVGVTLDSTKLGKAGGWE